MLVALALAPAASAAPPAPVLVSPAEGKQFPPPLGDVTFEVDGQPDESAGSLHIQFTNADGTVDGKGSFQNESGVDDFALEQVAPGGARYQVEVPASAFDRYSDGNFYWQAYRILPDGGCEPIAGSAQQDCFQESAESRTFERLMPTGYGAHEPNNSRTNATGDFFNTDCAYLEEKTDVDWYRFRARRSFELKLRLENNGDSDRWVPLRSRKRESADMSVSVYREKGFRRIGRRHVAVGKTGVLKTKVRARKVYLFAVRHAGNGFRAAKPAANLYYGFHINLGGDFSDANGCT
jgi:hypothetical protein